MTPSLTSLSNPLSLSRTVFVGGDVIVHEGQPTSAMYFIRAGFVCVHLRSLGAQDWLVDLIPNDPRVRTFGLVAAPKNLVCPLK